MKKTMIFCIILLFVYGCENMSKQEVGTVTGAALGGLVGSRFGGGEGQWIATGAGVLVGAYLGNKIGQMMDKQDQLEVNQALESGKTGYSHAWRNPDSGANYNVVPTKTYYRSGNPCREFTTTAVIGGKTQKVYGKACRTADGDWKIVQ